MNADIYYELSDHVEFFCKSIIRVRGSTTERFIIFSMNKRCLIMFLAHTYFNVVSVCSFLWQILYKGYLILTLVYSRIHMCVEIMVASVRYHSHDAT